MIHEVRFSDEEAVYYHATIQFWHVDEGDEVEEGDDLVDIETEDDTVLTLKTPVGGILKQIFIEEGAILNPGDLLAIIEEMEE